MTGEGAALATSLNAGFESMVAAVVTRLAAEGHPGVTAGHEFALQAIGRGADTASTLGERLGVSKQAAGKTIAALEGMGYVDRVDHTADGRKKTIVVTTRGAAMVAIGAAEFDRLYRLWVDRVGPEVAEQTEQALTRLRDITPSAP